MYKIKIRFNLFIKAHEKKCVESKPNYFLFHIKNALKKFMVFRLENNNDDGSENINKSVNLR